MTELSKTEELEALLPWYATGQLSPDETRQVEAALREDAQLQKAFERIKLEWSQVRAENAAQPVPSSQMWDRLQARMSKSTEAASAVKASPGITDRIKSFVDSFELSVPQMAMAGAAALVIALQAGTIGVLWNKLGSTPTYETASGPQGTPAKGAKLLVAFQPDAPLSRISDLLLAIGGETVSGPKASGFYVVALKKPDLDSAKIEKILAQLRSRKELVRFVTPVADDGA